MKIAWIEGFQDLSMLYDGETHIAEALNAHILRYDLAPFEVGQLWLENVGAVQSAGVETNSFHAT